MAAARSRSTRPRGVPVGRLIGVGVMLLMAALYVSPVQKYLHAERQVRNERATLARLTRQNQTLRTTVTRLQPTTHGANSAIVAIARQCGWVYPGERTIVITGVAPTPGSPTC